MKSLRLAGSSSRATVDVSLSIVNIVLLLILFFLIAGELVAARALDADPARTRELLVESLPEPVLEILSDGTWQLNDVELDPASLGQELAEDVSTLHVVVDGDAPAEKLAFLLQREDLARVQIKLVTINVGRSVQ